MYFYKLKKIYLSLRAEAETLRQAAVLMESGETDRARAMVSLSISIYMHLYVLL